MKAVTLTVEDGLATMRLERGHGNAINGELVEGLLDACGRADAEPGVHGMLFASSGKLFCPGLDLQELIELDRPAMTHFLERFGACLHRLYTFSKPMVAAIQGPAVAGGCVLSLTADRRILRAGAVVGLNEVRVGVPLPFGVSTILRESVASTHLEEVALFGWNYTDDDAVKVGLVHEVHSGDDFEVHCRARLEELASKEVAAFSITKRYLRSVTAERMKTDRSYAAEFLDSWFSEGTRKTIRAVVDRLQDRAKGQAP